MGVEVTRVQDLVREGRVEQSVVVGVVEDDRWLLPDAPPPMMSVLQHGTGCGAPRRSRELQLGSLVRVDGRRVRGQPRRVVHRALTGTKKSIRHRGRDPAPSSARAPAVLSGSSRERRRDAVRAPAGRAGGASAPRGRVRLPRTRIPAQVDYQKQRAGTLDGLSRIPPASSQTPSGAGSRSPFARAEDRLALVKPALNPHCWNGCAPPSTRRAVRSASSSVVTASRRSSSVAPSSHQSARA